MVQPHASGPTEHKWSKQESAAMNPLNNLPDYSELGVCDGPLDRLADPVDVPGTRPGKDGSPAGGSLSTRLPRFAPPSRGSSRVEAAETILTRVSDGPRRAAGRGIVEGGCEQDRRDDDAPEAKLTGTLFQRRLATARAPRGGAHRRTAHRIPGSRAAPRLPRGRRADGRRDRRDRHDRTPSRPSPATETSPFSRRRGRQAVFRRIPPALGPLLP